MNPPIHKSVCEEEMQNADLDTNEVIIEYITGAHGNKIKKLKPLLIKSKPQIETMYNIYLVMMISLPCLKVILCKRER